MLRACRLGPGREAALPPGYLRPRDRDTVLDLAPVLWIDHRAVLDRAPDALPRSEPNELRRVLSKGVGAEEHALAAAVKARARIGNLRDRKIAEGDAAIDRVIFLPEAAPELETDLHRCSIAHGCNRRPHRAPNIQIDPGEHGKRNGAEAPIGACGLGAAGLSCVLERYRDAARVLSHCRDFRAEADDAVEFTRECACDHV